jgi:hypothetical protein
MGNQFKSESNTSYNQKQMQDSMMTKVNQMREGINKCTIIGQKLDADPIVFMDYLEQLVSACGGESKITFLDVGRDFIKLSTRVPMTANLYQFMPESPENPRFHKTVTKILLTIPVIESIRWLPAEGGALLLVKLRGRTQ